MQYDLLTHNTHLELPGDFTLRDPHLRRLRDQTYQFKSSIIDEIPRKIPGIYNLVGGRQIGKTTLLKQWMKSLLDDEVEPSAIRFISCELIPDMHTLHRIVMEVVEDMPAEGLKYIILDEITYVDNWDRAIKYLADSGIFENTIVIISGSDLVLMRDARMRFPGRRGKADKVDYHYYPLSFREILDLKNKMPKMKCSELDKQSIDELYGEFSDYLVHGGFLSAINEYADTKRISKSTLATYSDWIRGDVIKRNKSEHYLRDIISAVFKHYTKQISWRDIVKGLSIDHYQTAIDYSHLLESMDVLFIQDALKEDKLEGAPKKNRRLMFCDPFIFHSLKAWLNSSKDPYEDQILPTINNPIACSELVESSVISHFRRYYPTYYIKADGEVDVAYIKGNKFWPVEVKWSNQVKLEDVSQILKYKNGKIYAKVNPERLLQKTPIIPLPCGLLEIGG